MENPETFDVIVVGSGAGGLATAVTAAHAGLSVLVVEKSAVLGGTSAWSGGWLWVPNNPLAVAAGMASGIDVVRQYLKNVIGNRADDKRVQKFLDQAPRMVEFFESETEIEWVLGSGIPDFYPVEGAASGGRSVSVKPYDGRDLGPLIALLRPPAPYLTLWGLIVSAGHDMQQFFAAKTNLAAALYCLRRLARHARDLIFHRRSLQLANGNALVARLLKSADKKGVKFLTNATVSGLCLDEGRVSGIEIGDRKINAAAGVVLATGGFPHDPTRQKKLFGHMGQGSKHYSAAPQTNSGDGLNLAESAGAALETDFPDAAAWAPVSLVPDKAGEIGHFPHLVERAKPGIIAVGADGKRFVNEANSYHEFMSALFERYDEADHFAWIIADAKAAHKFGLGWAKPVPFLLGSYVRKGYLRRSRTLDDLARQCSLPADALEKTINRFNQHARIGTDPDFHRGESSYNRVQGDAANRPNASLRPLEHPPYFAVKIVPGSLGTFAGIRTNESAQVLDAEDAPIGHLYAVGNDMASIFGGHYPSGGITLGPAMTFGFIAGNQIAADSNRRGGR